MLAIGMKDARLKSRAARATWWSTLEIASRYVVQFVLMVVLARLLEPASFGVIAMVLVFTGVAAVIVESGFGAALIQRRDTTPDDETTVFLFSLGSSLALLPVLYLLAPSIADFYDQPQVSDMLRLLALTLPLGAAASVPDALLSRKLEFRSRAGAELVSSLASGTVAIVLALRGAGVWALVWQTIVSSGLRTFLLWVFSGWRPNGRFSIKSLRQLWSFGGYMLLSNLLDVVSVRLQAFLIGIRFDARALGLYTIAQNTQQAPTSLFGSVMNRVGLPVFSSVSDDPAKLRDAVRLSLQVSMFLFVPCMVGLSIVASPLVLLLYGSDWEAAAPVLTLLSLAAAFWPMHVLNLSAISAQGRADLYFRLSAIRKILAITLIALASYAGPIAIAATVLATSVVALVINTHYSGRILGYGLTAQIRDQGPTFALSIVAALTSYFILHFCAPGALATVASIVAAVVVYLGGAILTKARPWVELQDMLMAAWARPVVSSGRLEVK